jgi:2-polyprenyl-6-hydroxyphenyl methylase/3-demethylubiquinone-9 3-methyltransferase
VHLTLNGLRPSVREMLAWLAHRRDEARMVVTPSTAVLFQGVGVTAHT